MVMMSVTENELRVFGNLYESKVCVCMEEIRMRQRRQTESMVSSCSVDLEVRNYYGTMNGESG